jgi:hypothetical protein
LAWSTGSGSFEKLIPFCLSRLSFSKQVFSFFELEAPVGQILNRSWHKGAMQEKRKVASGEFFQPGEVACQTRRNLENPKFLPCG